MTATATALRAPGRMRVWTSLALAFALIASLVSSITSIAGVSAQAAAEDTLAASVPADTVIYMAIDLNQESEQWTQAFSLFERAGLNDVAEDEVGASTEELGDSAESMNFTGSAAIVFTDADALMESATGPEFAAETVASPMDTADSVMTDAAAEVPAGFAMVIQPDDSAALSAQFEAMVADEAEANGATVATVDYNGVTITYWESADATITSSATATVGDVVVLGTVPSDIEPIIDTVQGDTESLASTDGFSAVYSKLETNSMIFGYVDADAMMTALVNSPNSEMLLGTSDDVTAELDAARGHMGWTVYASETGFHMDSVIVPLDPANVPTADGFTPSMASSMPADVMMFANSNNLYATGVTEMLGTLLQTSLAEAQYDEGTNTAVATPASTPSVDETWAMMEQMLGFNPDTDLLQKLDGEYAMYAGVYDLESGVPTPEFLFVSGTSDAATLNETMAQVTQLATEMNAGDYEMSSRTVEGGELTVMTFPGETTGLVPVVLEFGVVNDEMLIGVNGAIDKYLAGDSETLADSANFQAAFAELPSENLMSMSYMDIEGQVLPLLDYVVVMMDSSSSTLDNHEDCATYATQEEAQAAYDADSSTLWLLDMDYDGEACEDFFGEATAQASPELVSEQVNVVSAGSVTWADADAIYSNSVIVIGD